MSILDRLEAALVFGRANEWGQGTDKQEHEGAPDGFAYCARGWIIYGGFTEAIDGFCPSDPRFHLGDCREAEWGCENDTRHPVMGEFEAVHDFVDELLPALDGSLGVAIWNDAPSRTKDEVIALMEKAIARAREGKT